MKIKVRYFGYGSDFGTIFVGECSTFVNLGRDVKWINTGSEGETIITIMKTDVPIHVEMKGTILIIS